VAVVGTRTASQAGLEHSAHLARLLVEHGVTVVSGLAHGIDTAAHQSTLDNGGRTIAVIGTGIRKCFPADNAELSRHIVDSGGAIVSQFWPDAPPAKYAFPRRNITMSGIAQGTVVIEASSTSGARLQAGAALRHGKKVFLVRSLTDHQEWARTYVKDLGARQIETVEEVIDALVQPEHVHAVSDQRMQLTHDLG